MKREQGAFATAGLNRWFTRGRGRRIRRLGVQIYWAGRSLQICGLQHHPAACLPADLYSRLPPSFSHPTRFPESFTRYLFNSLRERRFDLRSVPMRLHLGEAKNPYADRSNHDGARPAGSEVLVSI